MGVTAPGAVVAGWAGLDGRGPWKQGQGSCFLLPSPSQELCTPGSQVPHLLCTNARQGKRRIPEATLFLSALLGGSLGAVVGMNFFRHKTKHWYFVVGMPLILLVQLAAVLWLLR